MGEASKWLACAAIIAVGAMLAGCSAVALDKGWELSYAPPDTQPIERPCSITVFEFQDDRPEQAIVGGEYAKRALLPSAIRQRALLRES